jgi:hypothetical protein
MATASAGPAATGCREAPALESEEADMKSPHFRNRRTENRRRTYRSIPRRAAPPLLSRHRVSRLLKKLLRFRDRERRRDFVQLGTAGFRGFGLRQRSLSFVFHVAGRTSPLGAKSLGRRTML